MCGITGWVSFGRDLRAEQATVDAMTETMSCRGPDDRGTWFAEHAALGHRRLAIIDLPGGRQPMSADTPGGAVAIVYSGEAYNFTELRAELIRRGHRFRTDSDTEVVLHAYLEWGDALAERLNGMYAFAIWDSREDKLVMVRDRMGIKPFYYYQIPDGVLFGSEPKAILASPAAEHTVTLDGIRDLFAFIKPPGHAVWEGMHEVEPGTVVTVSSRHLTHFVRILLDRKDRMSMAVGLEVRVPFCDHRLVEYVYNALWSLKTYDGREKSLLRGAARDVLPPSVADRVKSPVPVHPGPGVCREAAEQRPGVPVQPRPPGVRHRQPGLAGPGGRGRGADHAGVSPRPRTRA